MKEAIIAKIDELIEQSWKCEERMPSTERYCMGQRRSLHVLKDFVRELPDQSGE